MLWSSRSIWHSSTTAQAVLSFRSPGLNLPRFVLRPAALFHRMGDVVGLHDIDFDAHPQFSKKYLLRGTDDEKVRDLFRSRRSGRLRGHRGGKRRGLERSIHLLLERTLVCRIAFWVFCWCQADQPRRGTCVYGRRTSGVSSIQQASGMARTSLSVSRFTSSEDRRRCA